MHHHKRNMPTQLSFVHNDGPFQLSTKMPVIAITLVLGLCETFEMEKCIAIRFNVDQNTWMMFKWMAKRGRQPATKNKQIWHASECTTCVRSGIEIEAGRVTLKWIIQHSTNDTFVWNSKIHEEKRRQNYQNYSIWKDSIWRIEIIWMEGIQLMTMLFLYIFSV